MVAHKLPANAVHPALYEALLGLPQGVKGEIFNEELHVVPHAFSVHSVVASRLNTLLGAPFEFGMGGPGGWLFAADPQLNLGESVVCPDLAAWQKARAPAVGPFFIQTTPDWVAEVLSGKTWKQDRGPRMEAWGQRGTSHVWLLDPDEETLEVHWNDAGVMRPLHSFQGRVKVRAAPFEAVELDLGLIWPHP
jgi:Uma2 family endonuclease